MTKMNINIESNLAEFADRLRALGDDAGNVIAVELSRTAWQVRDAIKGEMLRAFRTPVPWTLNGILVKPASRNSLSTTIMLKDDRTQGTPTSRYLAPEIDGGTRGHKGMEMILIRAGLMYRDQYAVPGMGAQMTANGNVRPAQIIQILSQLGVQQGAGYESRKSKNAASKRTVAKQGVTYFALRQARRNLKPGIYAKKGTHGSNVKPVFLFVNRANYKPLLKFYEVGQEVADRCFPINFDVGIEKAIDRARLR